MPRTNVKMKERPGKEFGDDESKHQARHCVHSNVNASHRTILPPFPLPNTTRPAFTRDFKAWQKNQQRTYWKPTLTYHKCWTPQTRNFSKINMF